MPEQSNQIVTFNYEGTPISFNRGDAVMVNATEMAKPFGKRPVDWLNNQQTNEFINELSKVRNLTLTDLVIVTRGGNNPGTWMHEDVAMEFAHWLSPKFGEIRTTVINGEPWFVGKDVAERLGYSNTADAILKHIDEEDRLESQIAISGQNRKVILINESGLYSLVLRSNLPTAKQFKRWVTSEVLPSIRKHGAYLPNLPDFSNPAAAARAWAEQYERSEQLAAQEQKKEKKALINADFADIFRRSQC